MTATILVVDDLEQNIKLLSAKLVSEYYTVLTASSGEEALEILNNKIVDIVLLDAMMPGMDGFDTCKHIKKNSKTTHIPVVMVTALTDIEDRVKGLEAGADEFLTKPINDTALFARVKSLARMKSVIDELKLRNKINAELGSKKIKVQEDFSGQKILLIDDDIVQARNIKNNLSSLFNEIRIIYKSTDFDTLGAYVPDVIIFSCQVTGENPLRAIVNLKSKPQLKYTVFMMLAEEETVPMVIKGMDIGINDYFIYPVDESELHARVKTQLRRKIYQNDLRQELEKSVDLAIKDGLTGLFNRRYFDIHIEQLIHNAQESNKALCLLMIDIDNFKKINDTYGHQCGDKVLKHVANIFKSSFRVTDLISRYGGEEFGILISNIDINMAIKIAENIRQKIEATEFNIVENQTIQPTISVGVAQYNGIESSEEFIMRGDKALYQAKHTGRNKVVSDANRSIVKK